MFPTNSSPILLDMSYLINMPGVLYEGNTLVLGSNETQREKQASIIETCFQSIT